MASETFAVGDTVELKTDGPPMTVVSGPDSADYYTCTWFAGKKNERARFPSASLRRMDDSE